MPAAMATEPETSNLDRRDLALTGEETGVCASGAVLWLTGLSGAGKTTLAHAMEKALLEAGRSCTVLDGDVLRAGVNRDLGFSEADRNEAVRRAALMARSLSDAGHVVLVSMISPLSTMRDMARDIVSPHVFHEVYISTPLAVCETRDPKGLYKKARAGEISLFTGISAPYEVPSAASVTIDTNAMSLEDAVRRLSMLVSV